jgi:hypothetical protein
LVGVFCEKLQRLALVFAGGGYGIVTAACNRHMRAEKWHQPAFLEKIRKLASRS